MFVYTFAGKVLPERAYVTIGPIRPMKVQIILLDGVLEYEAHIFINTAQIMFVARSNEPIENLETLRNSVEQVVRSIVDAFGYIEGRGYDVEITSAVDSSGQRSQVFPVEIGAIQAAKGERPLTLGELLDLLNSGAGDAGGEGAFKLMQLRLALSDLREAIRSIDHSAFFCFRAIECVRQCYVEEGEEDNNRARRDSWSRMRKELRIDRSWVKEIEDASMVERHGRHRATTGEQRTALMLRTWKVIDRFIMSAKSGFQPLSEDVPSLG